MTESVLAGDALFPALRQHFLGQPGVGAARIFASEGLNIRGKYFALLSRGRLVVKLPKAEVNALLGTGRGELFSPCPGRTMKEWVVLGPTTLADARSLAETAKTYVASLGPAKERRSRPR